VSHATNQVIAIAIKGSIVIESKNTSKDYISKSDIEQMIQDTKTKTEYIKPNDKLSYLSIILSIIAISIVIYQNI